jgi:membrane protein implicated in regulation of membrane protease activity
VTQAFLPLEESGEFLGMVRLHGELWRALSREAVPVGAHVRVTSIVGLTVHVVPLEHHAESR